MALRRLLALPALLLGFIVSISPVLAATGWAPFMAVSSSQPSCSIGCIVPEGAGGFLTGLSIANDDTMIVRTDTYGAYLWNATALSPVGTTGEWQQLVNATSMGSAVNGNTQGSILFATGICEIQIAAKNSQIMYMIANTYIANQNPPYQALYKSTNQGASWTATGFTALNFQCTLGSDNAGALNVVKAWGPKMSIDPTDATAQTVYVGTGANGLWETTNGGTSWSEVSTSSVPVALQDGSSNYPGYVVVMSGFTAGDVFAYSYGNGVYLKHSGSWSNISSGGPSVVTSAQIDPNTGYYFAVDGSGNAWRYIIGTGWKEIYTTGGDNATAIAVDPDTASGGASNHIVIGDTNGNINESTNAGTTTPTFGGWITACNGTCSSDVPWLAIFGVTIDVLYFDRLTAKTLLAPTDRAFWNVNYAGGSANWASQSRGIEQLVGTRILVPATAAPVTASWDSAVFTPNLRGYPSTFYPGGTGLAAGFGLDFCSSSTGTIIADVDGSVYSNSVQDSASSSNGGASWTALSSLPSNAYPTGNGGGSVACSTPNNFIFGGIAQQPYYTTNGGSSWSAVAISGANWSNFQTFNDFGGQPVCADRVASNTFFLFLNQAGFYTSTNSGASWSSVGTLSGSQTSEAQIKCTPGQAGDWWFSGGNGQGADQTMPCGQVLLHYYSGSVTTITNVECPSSVGFGYNSGGYPSVFVIGWVNVSGTYTYGLWRSDNASTGAAPAWNLVTTWPCNSLDSTPDVSGDPAIYGRAYVAFSGSGFCRVNFLLKRDIDPASNDDTPVGMDKAA